MNKIITCISFLLLFPSFVFAANGYWDTMIWEQDTWYIGVGKLKGKITTSVTGQNTPIVGATVVTDTGQTVKTGTDGSYTLSDVPEGKHTVSFKMNGFSTVQLTDVSVSEGGTTDLAVKEMAFGCGLKGDIDDDGKIGLEEAVKALQTVSGIQ